MRIAVLSDTHLRPGRTLPRFIWEQLTEIDMILHAGDLTNPTLLEELEALAPVHAVKGNCDDWDVALPDQKIIACETFKIGLIHGSYGKGRNTVERAINAFAEYPIDIIVFGHSHSPFMEWRNGVLLFNPGSPTDKRRESQFSMGFLEIHQSQIKAKHLFF